MAWANRRSSIFLKKLLITDYTIRIRRQILSKSFDDNEYNNVHRRGFDHRDRLLHGTARYSIKFGQNFQTKYHFTRREKRLNERVSGEGLTWVLVYRSEEYKRLKKSMEQKTKKLEKKKEAADSDKTAANKAQKRKIEREEEQLKLTNRDLSVSELASVSRRKNA